VDSPPQTAARLQPRYRRLLSLGAVLDESMLLFRRYWVTFAIVSSVSLLPPGLLLVWMGGAGMLSRSLSFADLQSGRTADPTSINASLAQLAAVGVYLLAVSLFAPLWSGAVVLTTDALMRGEQPSVSRVYGRAIRRYFAVLLSTLLVGVGWLGLMLLAMGLFVLTVFGVLGSLIAIVGLLLWWLRPGTRRTWLKWLIILTAPFGLAIYYLTRWGMFIGASVLENKGPVAALGRSAQLTERHWFRVFAILTVASVIIQVMLSVLGAFITIPFTIVEAFRGQLGLSPAETAITNAVTLVAQILTASIASIVYTVLFVDLRNRREGTDISERVSLLEGAPLPANG
jgi:hypothetical protein